MSDSARLYRGSLSPDEAVAKLSALVTQIDEVETVTLADAAGRVLAADLLAAQDLPATNNAAVDGYGVDAAFLAANPSHAFPVTGRAAAGHPLSHPVPVGEAVRIFTGAVMPDGVDAVAMHEFCEFDEAGNTVRIGSILKPGSNNRPAGENLLSGELIVAAGTRLTAADIGIAAAAGHGALQVRRRLRVGLLSMGDEVVAAGTPTGQGRSMIPTGQCSPPCFPMTGSRWSIWASFRMTRQRCRPVLPRRWRAAMRCCHPAAPQTVTRTIRRPRCATMTSNPSSGGCRSSLAGRWPAASVTANL